MEIQVATQKIYYFKGHIHHLINHRHITAIDGVVIALTNEFFLIVKLYCSPSFARPPSNPTEDSPQNRWSSTRSVCDFRCG